MIPPDDLGEVLQAWSVTLNGQRFVQWLREEQINLAETLLMSSQVDELTVARMQGQYYSLAMIIQALELEPTTEETSE